MRVATSIRLESGTGFVDDLQVEGDTWDKERMSSHLERPSTVYYMASCLLQVFIASETVLWYLLPSSSRFDCVTFQEW